MSITSHELFGFGRLFQGEAKIKESKETIHVGVQAVIIQDGKILLGLRKNGYQAGTWGLPGGKLELHETLFDAMSRELLEETGLVAKEMRLFCITDPDFDTGHHMHIGIEVTEFEGVPRILEPDKCGAWQFFDLNDLPSPIFDPSEKVLFHFKTGALYNPSPSRGSVLNARPIEKASCHNLVL